MSWLWGNETTEQAQIVVSALQGELDERETKIQALEAALRREQQEFQQMVQTEIRELETRRTKIEEELAAVNALIKEKQKIIQKTKNGGKKRKKVKAKTAATVTTDEEVKSPAAATKAVAAASIATDAKKKPTTLPMDEKLQVVAKEEPNVAFIIQRSTNKNTVVYAGQKKGKALDPTKPLAVYWIMYEKEGNPREDLNMIERTSAYGVACAPSPSNSEQYTATLAALRDRDCVLLLDEHGNVQARTIINGKKNMLLRRVYVQMTTSWGIPTVDYVEIFGVDPVTFAPVYEKKQNK